MLCHSSTTNVPSMYFEHRFNFNVFTPYNSMNALQSRTDSIIKVESGISSISLCDSLLHYDVFFLHFM